MTFIGKDRLDKLFHSTWTICILFLIKLLVYYYLIDWSVYSVIYTIISAGIIGVLFGYISETKRKHRTAIFSVFYIIISVVMFADVMYYNYYNQTVSVAQIWQIKNVAKVPKSFVATFIPSSILLFTDVPVLISCFKRYVRGGNALQKPEKSRRRNVSVALGILVFLFVSINPFNNLQIARFTGEEFFVNHIGDIYDNTAGRLFKERIDEKEVIDIIDKNKDNTGGTDLKGIAEGRNVIMIQIEAFQNFLINKSYNGATLTPNLNKLIVSDSLYFDNFYTNIGKGNTADAEFSALNSLYPVIERECYTLYQDNNYDGLPWKLKEKGYSTFAVHGYEGEFWNRRNAYPNQGIDKYYAMEELDTSDIIGLGISDESMFHQAVGIMKEQNTPFFSFLITLTNHHPFEIIEELADVPILPEDEDSKFASYLQTAHYTDKAIGAFIDELKAAGLYDNSIIILYGDHHGLNKDMDDNDVYMERFLGKTYDYDEMMKVPLIINIPGSGVNRTISTVSGQIDIFPTLANLLNLEYDSRYVLGQDAVNASSGFVAFTAYMLKGSFIADNVMYEMPKEEVYEAGRAWEPKTGKELNVSDYTDYYNKAIDLKTASEEILEQDLIPPNN